jgi:hypothetical protein
MQYHCFLQQLPELKGLTSNDRNIFTEKSLLFSSCQLDIPTGIRYCRPGMEKVTEYIITVGEN